MDEISRIEREHFDCPEVNCKDYSTYPLVSDEEFKLMRLSLANEEKLFFLYLRENHAISYIDIYVWHDLDCMDDNFRENAKYSRFIIRDSYRLPYEDEKKFLSYVHCINTTFYNKTVSVKPSALH